MQMRAMCPVDSCVFSVKTIAAIGECMAELSHRQENLYAVGYAGDSFNTLWYARAVSDAKKVKTKFVSAVGTDELSEKFMSLLSANNIDASAVVRRKNRTIGLYLISLDTHGERSFTYWRSQSAARTLADSHALLSANLDGVDCVFFSGITLAILNMYQRQTLFDCLRVCKKNGALIAFDSNFRPKLWESERAMIDATIQGYQVSSLALPTRQDEMSIFCDASDQSMVDRIRSYGVSEVVIKNGPADCSVWIDEQRVIVPAVAVPHPVDTTGAGDSFNGVYIASRLAGKTGQESARAAHGIAAQVIMSKGALVEMSKLRTNFGLAHIAQLKP
jgi:2-dehydro-3-deoxygluconokinase